MNIGPLWGPSLRTSPPALDLEALRVGAAMEHIEAHGNLDRFPARRGERVALVSTAVNQGLLVWNRGRGSYELTSRGHRRVRALRRAGRKALRDPQGGSAVHAGMNAVVTAASAVIVLGAAFLAFNPAGSTDSVPAREPGAYFAGGAAAPARAQAVPATQPRADVQPRAVTAAAVTDSKQVSSEQVSSVSPGRGADSSGADGRIQGAETARSPAAAVPSEPEIAPAAAAPAAPVAPAQKTTTNGRDPPETSKLAHTHKRSARSGRNGNVEPETAGPGYGYGPYGGTPSYRHWSAPSASPWWFR
jgi:hypothetical protein